MKHLLLILILFPMFVNGQWGCYNEISFDPGDTVTPYLDWHVAVTIDTINFHHNIWQVGKPHKDSFTTAWASPNAIVTDTLNPYPSNDTSVFILKIPAKIYEGSFLHTLVDFSFVYKLDIDTSAIAKVEISEDAGLHWTSVTDSLPYGFGWSGTPPVLAASTVNWTGFNMNVGGYWLDSDIFFRFTFISDSVTTINDGWIIDDILVEYWCESSSPFVEVAATGKINPNPATTSMSISSPTKITRLTIANPLGQTVYRQDYNSQEISVDVSTLPAGMYIVRINDTDVRRFVKQ